jgi:hypothetical protein
MPSMIGSRNDGIDFCRYQDPSWTLQKDSTAVVNVVL